MVKLSGIVAVVIAVVCTMVGSVSAQEPVARQVRITFIGHACFIITTGAGTTIVTDPPGLEDYPVPAGLEADIVTVSHEHFDHNNVPAVGGEPIVLRGMRGESRDGFDHVLVPIDSLVGDVRVRDVESRHFPPEESPALNAVFVYEFDGITIVHLGDIGVVLTDEQVQAVGPVDILMIPTGGKYTLEPDEVEVQIAQLDPKVVIPMHFATDVAGFLPHSQDDFLQGKENVLRLDAHTWVFDPAMLPAELTYVGLRYMGR